MANFYQKYYNGYRVTAVDKLNQQISHGPVSDRQRIYFDALESFLTERGVYSGFLGKPRNRNDCKRKISALRTIMTKNGLWDEWKSQKDVME